MRALYRRYRPVSLADVVGQPQVTEPLLGALKSGKISHAYLFIGPRGTGKTSVARIFAHEVNGFKYELEDDYVDIVEIDGASNRGIDNIRELREKAAIAPTSGKYKIYIIDEVHMLTKEAFNALLKTLEEPPAHVIFIMATTDAYKVPVTITSRAQTFTFKLADAATMFEYLKKVCKEEKIKISDEALRIIVKRGGGSFRDSLSLLDQLSTLSSDEITKELVTSALGLAEDEKINQLLENYAAGDLVSLSQNLKELLSSGVKAETLVEEMISLIVDNPKPSLISLLAKLTEIKAPFAEAKLLVALARITEKTKLPPVAPPAQPIPTVPVQPIQTTPPIQPIPTAPLAKPKVESKLASVETKDFNWDGFITEVHGMNDAIAAQVKKCRYVFNNDELKLYPDKKVTRMILARDNNKRILVDAGNGIKITICEVTELPSTESDKLISKISDIMGGEVQNDGGDNPF